MVGAIILQIVLIALNAVFASAEIAVISMNEIKVQKASEDGDKRAKKILRLTEQPARFLATIQVAITMAGLLGSAFAAENFAGVLVQLITSTGIGVSEAILKPIAVFLITMILAYFNLVFGELVPKRIAMKKSDQLALGMAGMLSFVSKLFAPLVWLLTVSTNGILHLLGMKAEDEEEQVSEEEIQMLLEKGSESGVIDEENKEIISNVFDLDDMSAEEVCTHRRDVISLDMEDSMEEWENIIQESRHTYYPVYENMEDVVGILDTRDYFRLKDHSRENVIKNAVKPAIFIPETMKVNVIFQNMKESRNYFTVVLDEYGGISGILTLHDVIETLVGDLNEKGEETVTEIEKIDEKTWRIYGQAELEDVAEELNLELPTEEYHTYSGYIFSLLGKIPKDGSTFTVTEDKFTIQVLGVKNHRIGETRLTLNNETKEQEEETA
ncbi:MAG: hemolysin family protein [Lachnospiraceae bacterium]|nr:HlyC/CorC family transporter [Candidatus Fimimorpha excrementavium]